MKAGKGYWEKMSLEELLPLTQEDVDDALLRGNLAFIDKTKYPFNFKVKKSPS